MSHHVTEPPIRVPAGIILVIRTDDRDEAALAARAAAQGGIDAVEITLTVPNAIDLIAELGDIGVPIGVGTVLKAHQVAPAVTAGASFVVAPNTNTDVVSAALKHGIPMIAGALTPTEVEAAHRLGCEAVKVFPAGSVGGPLYIEELKGPLPHIPMVVSGGVSSETANDYFSAGAHAICVGLNMFSDESLSRGKIHELITETRMFMTSAGR